MLASQVAKKELRNLRAEARESTKLLEDKKALETKVRVKCCVLPLLPSAGVQSQVLLCDHVVSPAPPCPSLHHVLHRFMSCRPHWRWFRISATSSGSRWAGKLDAEQV